MLEVLARSLAARTTRWERESGAVATPAFALPSDPGPLDAVAALRRIVPHVPLSRVFDFSVGATPGPLPVHVSVRAGFAPGAPDGPVVDLDLSFPAAARLPLDALNFSESLRAGRRGGAAWPPESGAHRSASAAPEGATDLPASAPGAASPAPVEDDDATGGVARRLWTEAPAASQALVAGAGEIAVLAAAASHFRDPERFAPLAAQARTETGWGRLLYAPLVGRPADYALLLYAGIDILDATGVELATLEGSFLLPDGEVPVARAPACLCAACVTHDPRTDREALLAHNLLAARGEVERVRAAIVDGTLRTLVEARARASPHRTALLRRLDEEAWFFSPLVPSTGAGEPVAATGLESLTRPDVALFRARVADEHRKPEGARVLLVLPCSARKPYSLSRTHRRFAEALEDTRRRSLVHEVIVTSPLGLVPRELEALPPAATYDAAVTGVWDAEEVARIRETTARYLARNSYDCVVVHCSPGTYEVLRPVLPGGHVASLHGSPASGEALGALRSAILAATKGMPVTPFPDRRLADLAALAAWQFGEAAAERLLAGCHLRGRWPAVRLESGRVPVAAHVPERGALSLALEGGRRLWAARTRWVAIDDFAPRGTLFAVGVRDADASIRRGDEVVLVHASGHKAGAGPPADAEVRGVGRAVATGTEMVQLRRGACVEVRHHA